MGIVEAGRQGLVAQLLPVTTKNEFNFKQAVENCDVVKVKRKTGHALSGTVGVQILKTS